MDMEDRLHKVISQIMLIQYPIIDGFNIFGFGPNYYRVVYYFLKKPPQDIANEIARETGTLFKMLGPEPNSDVVVEFVYD